FLYEKNWLEAIIENQLPLVLISNLLGHPTYNENRLPTISISSPSHPHPLISRFRLKQFTELFHSPGISNLLA
ncbi:TPA: hypothetical protein ACIRLG_002338, partial [Streptococcus suis]